MLKQKADVLGVPVDSYTMDEAVNEIMERTAECKKTFVVTANAEIIMMCQSDADYMRIMHRQADIILPDGAGVVWGGRKLGYEISERVAGYDLYLRLIKQAAQRNLPVYFLGGAPGVADEAARILCQRYDGLKVAGTRHGYFKDEAVPGIVREINESRARLLFVALGAPKQEKWLAAHAAELTPSLLMGIGGSFDVVVGRMQRAPKWMQDAKLEWLFRLIKQPSRWRRMLQLPRFVFKIYGAKR